MSTDQSARPAPFFAQRKIFITGANGFIGANLAARLRQLGARVTGVDLVADPANGIIAGSTADPAAWASALDGVDAVVHLAALVSTVVAVETAWDVNVLGTKKVIDAAVDAGVRRFVHLSSIAAYGWDFPDHVTEDYPTRVTGGLSTYVDTKTNSELVALANANRGMEMVVVRPADVYGPGSVWIREPIAMAKANQLILPERGSGVFDVIYIDNFVDAMVLVLATEGIAGEVFNLGEELAVSCREYFGEVASWTGAKVRSVPIRIGAPALGAIGRIQRRLGMSSELGPALLHMLNRRYVVSNDKARDRLGFKPVVSYHEGMARSKEWARHEGLI
ncbi:3 beta-hydroxysteroid dehydrogenase/Delta 5--_4-isomerase [Mycobacterium marinum]|uniref:NAD-dependent epimerase/dehydratase family protein n=1 Tax=Mycobacterium marinum TaxID=1781 RepID=UPI00035872E5|nr:NAD-dependent epimerase/dehydratase family protein [Mycobacterium marinum]AXN45309.1 3 beta-hydroxysteroid dehydrogenase/Delta 5-->4-isomerase [Mycobacterium marinum]AXN50608.1 3 beta-hydroxysteroid dehydrogenase/Delta 5-->4-isomerase [Mycobacterium marinum]EPQ75285.1 putative oxidoreductase protein [Mycobacterium marinum str. Europe]RFZ02472.1 3 beta-hydroxysteroid dehydrogenase/Delta 5-->4-isomerase [Mycobacterium marinum]RFZ18013.1 3 beta-hydroxysteroid dehydrogenase/Delta 5-->4-isomeras